MPTIDSARGLLVIRIVYDGPALSGKTTSLRALAEGVGSKVESPEERDGRTLYFDWMEYVGGLFEGRQIRCQIVSVPGQRELAARRQVLLESADAVVCVLDTRRDEVEFGLSWLRELVIHTRADDPPVGIVVQANKRDAADALPRAELRRALDEIAPLALVESVATASDGIREAFVLAVRLALDRVRALSQHHRLQLGTPAEDNAQDLLAVLHDAEARTRVPRARAMDDQSYDALHMAHVGISGRQPVLQTASDEGECTFVPDPSMPGGMIWPPVDGRALLHEVAGLAIRPQRTARGDWWGSGAGWRFHSSPHALYDDANTARAELIGWARLHAANAGRISTGRAVILADAGNGRLRLWQLVKVESALRERLDQVLSASDGKALAEGLLEVATLLLQAREWFESGSVELPCTLWTVGSARQPRPCFVGLMPDLSSPLGKDVSGRALLDRELGPHLRELRRARVDHGAMLRELMARAELATPESPQRILAELARSMH